MNSNCSNLRAESENNRITVRTGDGWTYYTLRRLLIRIYFGNILLKMFNFKRFLEYFDKPAESFFRIVFRNIFLNMKIVIDCQTGSLLVKLLWLSWWLVRLRLRLSMTEVWWETEVWGLLSRCYPGPASSSQWWVSTLSKIIWLKPAGRLMASRKRSSSRSSCINYLSLITCR